MTANSTKREKKSRLTTAEKEIRKKQSTEGKNKRNFKKRKMVNTHGNVETNHWKLKF